MSLKFEMIFDLGAELNAVSESCNELLDKIDSLELRLEEP